MHGPVDFVAHRESRRFPALDGVRAVAAVAVVVFHFGGPSFAWASGWLGVHVFFVLSGFLITTLALREEDRRGKISLRDFYVRRVFRIWPAYFAVLAVLVGLFVLRGEYEAREIGAALPWYATFNVDLWPHGDILYIQTWTIGIEQKFYLLWPLLAFLPGVPGLRRNRLALIAGLFVVGAASWDVTDGRVVSYLVIAVGCLVAVLLHRPSTFQYTALLARPGVAAACWALFLAYQLAVPTLVRIAGGEPLVILGYGFAVGLIMPSLVLLPALGRLFGGRFLTWVGERSYSLYLVQGLAGWLVAMAVPVFGPPRLLSALAVVIASTLIADLVYRGVELPFIQLGRRFTSGGSRAGRRGTARGRHGVGDVSTESTSGWTPTRVAAAHEGVPATARIPVPYDGASQREGVDQVERRGGAPASVR